MVKRRRTEGSLAHGLAFPVVCAHSVFAGRATLRWAPARPFCTELVVGAVDVASGRTLDDVGRAKGGALGALGACVVDARLVAGRKVRFFVSAGTERSELSRPVTVGTKDFGQVALNTREALAHDAGALVALLATPRSTPLPTRGAWSSKQHRGATRVLYTRALGLLRIPRLATAAAASSESLYAVRSDAVNMANVMKRVLGFATPHCTPTRAEQEAVSDACFDQDVDALNALLREGVSPNTATRGWRSSGAPLLCAAAEYSAGAKGTVEALLAWGADVDGAACDGRTPLIVAAAHDDLRLVNQLIAAGADVEKATIYWIGCGERGTTPLMAAAAQSEHVEVIERLIALGAKGGKALIVAAKRGNCEGVERLVHSVGAVGSYSKALVVAVVYGENRIVDQLLAALLSVGGDVNKGTPLFFAAQANQFEITGKLIAAGADVNRLTTHDGNTPLIQAVMRGHVRIAARLIDAGANVNKANADGCTPLFIAERKNCAVSVAMLLVNGAV